MASIVERIPVPVLAAVVRGLFALPGPVRRLLAGPPVRRDGQRLDPDMGLLLRVHELEGGRLGGDRIDLARQLLANSASITAGPPIPGVAIRSLTIAGPAGDLPARLYTPAGLADHSPLVVFYHGGGWVLGGLDSHDNPCRFLAVQAGARVLAVDYRLAPEHRFPAAVDDAVAAFRWAVRNAEDLHADPGLVAVAGDSAGGNLAAVVCHLTARTAGPRPVFALLFYPGADSSVRRPSRDLFDKGFLLTGADISWFMGHYQADDLDSRFSVWLADNLADFPPTYLAIGGFDPLRDEVEALGAKLTEAGVPTVVRRHPELIHGFLNFIGISARSREAVTAAVGALRTGFALADSVERGRAVTPEAG